MGFTAGSDRGYETFLTKIAEGRFTTPEDAGKRVVVLGADLSRKFGKGVGDTLEIRGAEFEVIGVREPTLMFFDTTAVIPPGSRPVVIGRGGAAADPDGL